MLSAPAVDPDLLRSRIAVLRDPATRARLADLVERTLACTARVNAVDFAALERAAAVKGARDLRPEMERRLTAVWRAVDELVAALAPIAAELRAAGAGPELPPEPTGVGSDPEPAPADEDEVVLEGEDGGPGRDASASVAIVARGGPARPEALGPEDRVRETAWAMTFVLTSETEAFRTRLSSVLALADPWEAVSAVQEHLGRVQSAVGAVATGIFASLPGIEGEQTRDDTLQIVASRELRASLFQLRDDILEIEASLGSLAPSAWQPALERARRLVEELVFSAAFGWMRAGDKRALLVQKGILAEVSQLWSPLRAEPARRAVQGLARYLEALEVINQRECLVEHDRAALASVVASLERAAKGGAGARYAVGRALAALAEAQGRDRELDQLLAQTLDPSRPAPLDEILARARVVLATLGAGEGR